MTSSENIDPRIAWPNKMGLIVMALAGIDQDLTTIGNALNYGPELTELASRALNSKADFDKAAEEMKAARETHQVGENGLYQETMLDASHPSLLSAQEEAGAADQKLKGSAEDYAALGRLVEGESSIIALIGEVLTSAQTAVLNTGPAIQTIQEAAAEGQQATG